MYLRDKEIEKIQKKSFKKALTISQTYVIITIQ